MKSAININPPQAVHSESIKSFENDLPQKNNRIVEAVTRALNFLVECIVKFWNFAFDPLNRTVKENSTLTPLSNVVSTSSTNEPEQEKERLLDHPLEMISDFPGMADSEKAEVVENLQEKKAATRIQSWFRGYLARKAFLPHNLYSEYKAQCNLAVGENAHPMPRANAGITKVYLPKEMPQVVLKHSGERNAKLRFCQMQKIRTILESLKNSHLVIPKARPCGNFLVEERLPIDPNFYHNMGLYLSDPKLFDDAVREMVRLFSKVHIGDLIKSQNHPLKQIIGDVVRYDNLPLFIEEENGEKVGKIGLIDLETAWNVPRLSWSSLTELIRIFPYHLDLIIDEAQKHGISIEDPIVNEAFGKAAEEGRKYLKAGYADHIDWLRLREVSKPKSFEVSEAKMADLTIRVKNELLKLNQGENEFLSNIGAVDGSSKDFLQGNIEKSADILAKMMTPAIVKNFTKQFNKYQDQYNWSSMAEDQLVDYRSPTFNREDLFKPESDPKRNVIRMIINNSELIQFNLDFWSLGLVHQNIARQLVDTVLKSFVESGEFFHYDPLYRLHQCDRCWVRY
ncbi:MAG: hypothetical protein ACHQUC_05610 [Chlamydiales bacterium]